MAIGMKPNNGLILGKVMTDESGFVTADENMAANIPEFL